MMIQMLDRLIDEERALLPGTILTQQGYERRLARAGILAQPLAGSFFVAGMVEQAIEHLAGHGEEADMLRALARFAVERDH